MSKKPAKTQFSMLAEKSLHIQLKQWYAEPDDKLEVELDGYYIDIVRDDVLIEIQTRNFHAIKPKLTKLLDKYPVMLVHPIPYERWIVKLDSAGKKQLSRRKSPKRGRIEEVFKELLRIPHLVSHPNFTLDVLLVQDEEIRQDDGKGSWRRKGWSIADRRLLAVVEHIRFTSAKDFLSLLPESLPKPFTTAQLAKAVGISRSIAGKMAYTLRHMEAIEIVGKQGNAYLYAVSP